MSKYEAKDMECFFCDPTGEKGSTEKDFKVYSSIWGENPSNRKLVFENKINFFECNLCGEIMTQSYFRPLLYVDKDKSFAVWYAPRMEDDSRQTLRDFANAIETSISSQVDAQIRADVDGYKKAFTPSDNYYVTAPITKDWEFFKKTIIKFENGEMKAKPVTGLGQSLNEIYSDKNKSSSGCFIATATYESTNAPEVIYFRKWRDEVLFKTLLGRLLIKIYYLISPFIAKLIYKNNILKVITKYILDRFISIIDKSKK